MFAINSLSHYAPFMGDYSFLPRAHSDANASVTVGDMTRNPSSSNKDGILSSSLPNHSRITGIRASLPSSSSASSTPNPSSSFRHAIDASNVRFLSTCPPSLSQRISQYSYLASGIRLATAASMGILSSTISTNQYPHHPQSGTSSLKHSNTATSQPQLLIVPATPSLPEDVLSFLCDDAYGFNLSREQADREYMTALLELGSDIPGLDTAMRLKDGVTTSVILMQLAYSRLNHFLSVAQTFEPHRFASAVKAASPSQWRWLEQNDKPITLLLNALLNAPNISSNHSNNSPYSTPYTTATTITSPYSTYRHPPLPLGTSTHLLLRPVQVLQTYLRLNLAAAHAMLLRCKSLLVRAASGFPMPHLDASSASSSLPLSSPSSTPSSSSISPTSLTPTRILELSHELVVLAGLGSALTPSIAHILPLGDNATVSLYSTTTLNTHQGETITSNDIATSFALKALADLYDPSLLSVSIVRSLATTPFPTNEEIAYVDNSHSALLDVYNERRSSGDMDACAMNLINDLALSIPPKHLQKMSPFNYLQYLSSAKHATLTSSAAKEGLVESSGIGTTWTVTSDAILRGISLFPLRHSLVLPYASPLLYRLSTGTALLDTYALYTGRLHVMDQRSKSILDTYMQKVNFYTLATISSSSSSSSPSLSTSSHLTEYMSDSHHGMEETEGKYSLRPIRPPVYIGGDAYSHVLDTVHPVSVREINDSPQQDNALDTTGTASTSLTPSSPSFDRMSERIEERVVAERVAESLGRKEATALTREVTMIVMNRHEINSLIPRIYTDVNQLSTLIRLVASVAGTHTASTMPTGMKM